MIKVGDMSSTVGDIMSTPGDIVRMPWEYRESVVGIS